MTSILPIITRRDSATSSASELSSAKMDGHPASRRRSQSQFLDLKVVAMWSGAALSSVGCILIRYRQKALDAPLHMGFVHFDEIPVPLHLRSSILNLLHEHPKNFHAMQKVQQLLGQLYSSTLRRFCDNFAPNLIDSLDLVVTQADSIPTVVLERFSAFRSNKTNAPLQSWTAAMNELTGATIMTTTLTSRRPANRIDPQAEPSIDCLILRHASKFRICLTISDITRMSIVAPYTHTTTKAPPTIDIGPGTLFIDYAMRYSTCNQSEHDRDGNYGYGAKINQSVVDRFINTYDPSRRSPPLSIAAEMFGNHDAQTLIDECLFHNMSDRETIATVTRATAENILRQYRKQMAEFFPNQQVDELFICGPGAGNLNIVDYLESVLPENVITKPLEDIGTPGDAKDALHCAHLGLENILRHASLKDEALKAEEQQTLLGSFVKGPRWEATREKVARFCGGKELPPVRRMVVERIDLPR